MDSVQEKALFQSTQVFCNSTVLEAVQTSPFRPYDDSKSFVDLPLKHSPQQIIDSFKGLQPNPSKEAYLSFLHAHFHCDQNEELKIYVQKEEPLDFNQEIPLFFHNVTGCSDRVIMFARDLKQRWKLLCRAFRPELTAITLDRTSLIPLPHQFFIPGGRFREIYYWDTLWVVKGLIASDMNVSAMNVTRNLLHLVDRFGFVPNGNRVYYLNRTQPPVLTEAVRIVYNALLEQEEKIKWLEEAVPLLDKELQFFHRNRSLAVVHPNCLDSNRFLCVYAAQTKSPRPESYAEDIATTKSINDATRPHEDIFHNLASACESGWDFSSRWYTPHSTLSHIRIDRIVPICLNSWLVHSERTLSEFYEVLKVKADNAKADPSRYTQRGNYFSTASRRRSSDLSTLCWDRTRSLWCDFDLDSRKCTSVVSAATVMPVWAGCADTAGWTSDDARNFVSFISTRSGLMGPGGLACTPTASDEQWDFPNCWAPLVDLAVEALQRVEEEFPGCGAESLAKEIAQLFVRTVFKGWEGNGGTIHEKYDCTSNSGKRGAGGEYKPQTGFGWTNGTVLSLMSRFWNDSKFFQFIFE